MKMADISAADWQKTHSDDQLKTAIMKGVTRTKDGVQQQMDPFGTQLTPKQVTKLIAYIRTLAK